MPESSHQSLQRKLRYPFSEHPKPGNLVEVAPGVQWLTMPMGGSLDHINLYLLEDDSGWYVVDTGLGNDQTKQLWEQIFEKRLKGKPILGVICTHMHPDHIGQAGMITNRFRVPLLMTHGEYYQARSMFAGGGSFSTSWEGAEFYTRAGIDPRFMQRARESWRKRVASGMRNKRQETAFNGTPTFPSGFQRLVDGDILTIGGHDWRVTVGSGHSPEHACLHCMSLKVLLSGDQILPIITSNVSVFPTEPQANPLKAWMDSHDRFLDLPADTLVLPAHNLPFYGIRERLRDLINHHEDRMLAIEEHCVEPRTAIDLLPVLFKRKLDPRQQMMALGEAIAHCHLLMHRNRLERSMGAEDRYWFTSIDPDLNRRATPGHHDEPDDSPIMV